MIDLTLVLQTLIWLLVLGLYLQSGAASALHPLTYYLAFHGAVFVLRPILVYVFDLQLVFFLMQFNPTDDQFIFTLVVSTFGLLVISVIFLIPIHAPSSKWSPNSGFSQVEWKAFVITVIILSPLIFYSIYINFQSALISDPNSAAIQQGYDLVKGITYYENTTGYIAEAQVFAGSLCLMLIWGARFRLWTLTPLAIYFVNRAFVGWGRWTIVMTAISFMLLYLINRRWRWPPLTYVIYGLPILFLFTQLGANRETIRPLFIGRALESDVLVTGQSWTQILDVPDFANFDFLSYVVSVVPNMSGTYTYFAQYLQLFTEPIPRILWLGKPIGMPVVLVDLNDYGRFWGWTTSLVGDGWMSAGWIGVFITMLIVGLVVRRIYRWFLSGEINNFKALIWAVFLPLTLQWYRDGGISIAKFAFWGLLPIFVWKFTTRLLTDRQGNPRANLKILPIRGQPDVRILSPPDRGHS